MKQKINTQGKILWTAAMLLSFGLILSCAKKDQPLQIKNKSNIKAKHQSCLGIEQLSSTAKIKAVHHDRVSFRHAVIKNNKLLIKISYGCGCARHTFSAMWNGRYLQSKPPQANIHLKHNAHGEKCERLCRDTICVDIKSLQAGRINLYIGGKKAASIQRPED